MITWPGLNTDNFTLDHASNLFLCKYSCLLLLISHNAAAVRSMEHIKFDNFAVFAITGSNETLDRLIGVLTESNKNWQMSVNKYGPQEPRPQMLVR